MGTSAESILQGFELDVQSLTVPDTGIAEEGFVKFGEEDGVSATSAAVQRRIERRGAARLLLAIPIRVLGFDEGRGEVFEDTETIEISRTGARLALEHRVYPGDVIRIINLENCCEADFRIVGPARLVRAAKVEWGVECVESDRNIWEMETDSRAAGPDAGAETALECRACGAQEAACLTPVEEEVLYSSGIIARECGACAMLTYWTCADPALRPRSFAPGEPVAPPPRQLRQKLQTEKRREKRLGLQLPVRVRTASGAEESGKTYNISLGGLAVGLEMELKPGEFVSLCCPFTRDGQNIEQRAEVRWADEFSSERKRLYGFRFVR
jgi:hypothetical protein